MSQYKIMLKALINGDVLTRKICLEKYGIFESPARITEMRGAGLDINTRMVAAINRQGNKVRVAEWSLVVKAVA